MSAQGSLRAAATGARLVVGAAIATACVIGTVVAIGAPWPAVTHEPAQAIVSPLPADTVLVCNGDIRAIGRDSANPLRMESAGSPGLIVDGSGGDPLQSAIVADDLADAADVLRLTGEVEGRSAPLVGAAESIDLDTDDLFGFAAAPCRAAAMDSWLIGGSVGIGTEDLIVLTNSGAVTSTVALTAYGSVRGAMSVLVPAGEQIAVPLTSLAVGADAPVVRVSATGSPVRAVLQSSLTRTLDPAGLDLQDAIPAPQQHQVLTGVEIFEGEGDNGESAVLRLLAADADAQAVVTARAVGEQSAAEEYTVDLTAGEPVELSLASLAPGTYVVTVDADAPVLSGARVQEGSGPHTDFSWMTPAPEIADEVFVAVPAGPSARVILSNEGDEDAIVRLAPRDGGAEEEVTVPAGSSAEVAVERRTVYSVTTSAPVHAAVLMISDDQVAGWPVWPQASATQRITVYP